MLVLGATARAQQEKSDETARIHFKAGTSYYDTGDYELALREFNRSYELSGRPELQYNISLTYEKLGDLEAAIKALEKYLNEAKDIPNRKTLELRLANLNKRLEQQREAAAAEQAVPAAADEQPGSDGDVAKGQPEEAQEPVQPAPSTEPISEEPQEPAQAESEAIEPEGGDQKILGLPTEVFVSYAVASAGALTFIIFGSLAAAEDGSLSDECLNSDGEGTCGESDVSSLDTFSTVADIGLAFALVGGAVGTVLLLTSEDRSEQTSDLDVAPLIGANQMGAVARMRF
jgi:tetratricopeptide (TPR) repeat protein